jgi:hypothetical protein
MRCGRCRRWVSEKIAKSQVCPVCQFTACRCSECNVVDELDKAIHRHMRRIHSPGGRSERHRRARL